jgi:membrane-associated HD superfamily phosphohydrolase
MNYVHDEQSDFMANSRYAHLVSQWNFFDDLAVTGWIMVLYDITKLAGFSDLNQYSTIIVLISLFCYCLTNYHRNRPTVRQATKMAFVALLAWITLSFFEPVLFILVVFNQIYSFVYVVPQTIRTISDL